MNQAEGQMSCNASARLIRNRDVVVSMGTPAAGFEQGFFHVVHKDKDGNILSEQTCSNGTTQELAAEIQKCIDPDATPVAFGTDDRTARLGIFKRLTGSDACPLETDDTYDNAVQNTGPKTGSFATNSTVNTGQYSVEEDWTGSDANGCKPWDAANAFTLTPSTSTNDMTNATATTFTGVTHANEILGAFILAEDSTGVGSGGGVLIASANFSTPIASITSDDTINLTFTFRLTIAAG